MTDDPKGTLKREGSSLSGWVPPQKVHKYPFLHQENSGTTIGEDITIKGELSFPESLRIDGTFEGKLSSPGRLHVGPKGTVRSDLNLKSALIEGKVEGNITVEEHLELRSSAIIKGDITAATLKVDEGATLSGIVSISLN